MNQRCYRLIFNSLRGQWLAVAEHVSARGARSTSRTRQTSRRTRPETHAHAALSRPASRTVRHRRPLALLPTLLLPTLLSTLFPSVAIAQIVPAGPSGPSVLDAPNGVPIVNITTPTAAGVSHNQYQQFDVSDRGAILNNSRTIVQTQLGGLISGNPNLGPGTARLIVNEVTSALPSSLSGYLEVAGQRAEVIVSNPNGITCNGCGFINTSRGVLSTGLPVFGGTGSLDAFRVTSGTLNITGRGFNGSNLEHAALLARAVTVNAEVHARELDVVTGTNLIRAASFEATTLPDANGTANPKATSPTLALDVARLGGLYANKIRLIGTEAGLGVNIGGNVIAQAGTLSLSTQGQLTVSASGRLHATGPLPAGLSIAAAALDNAGTIEAEHDAHIEAKGDVLNQGKLITGKDLRIDAQGNVRNPGTLTVAQHAHIEAKGDVLNPGTLHAAQQAHIKAKGDVRNPGKLITGEDLRIDAQGNALNPGTLHTAQHLHVNAENGTFSNTDGKAHAKNAITVHAKNLENKHGLMSAGDTLRITAHQTLDNTAGRMETRESGNGLSIQAGTLDNTAGVIANANLGPTHLNVTGTLVNVRDNARSTLGPTATTASTARHPDNNGIITSDGDLHIAAVDIANREGARLSTGGALHIKTAADLANQNAFVSATSLTADVGGKLDNRGGTLYASHGIRASINGALHNQTGRIEIDGAHRPSTALSLTASALDNTDGRILHAGDGDVEITAPTLRNAATKPLPADDDRQTGLIAGKRHVTLHAAQIRNDQGRIAAQQNLYMPFATSLPDATTGLGHRPRLDNSGTLFARQTLAIGDAIRPAPSGAASAPSSLTAAHAPTSNAPHIVNTGAIEADGDATLSAHKLDNTGGRIATNRHLQLSTGKVSGDGVLNAGQNVNVTIGSDYTFDAGSAWDANGDMTLTVGGKFVNQGKMNALGQLNVHADALDNLGDDARLKGTTTTLNVANDLRNTGRLEGEQVNLRATRLFNHAAIVGQQVRTDATDITQQGPRALMAGVQSLDLFASGNVLNDDGATLFTLGNLRIGAGDARDAQGLLTQQSASVINRSATIEAAGDIDIATRQLVNERSFVHINKAVHEASDSSTRYVWVAGYGVDVGGSDPQGMAILPTQHISHGFSVNGQPATVPVEIEVPEEGTPWLVKKTVYRPNPSNQGFSQWRWHKESRSPLSPEKLYAAAPPIKVIIPKSGVINLDTDKKTFGLVHAITEVYQGSVRTFLSSDPIPFQTRTITTAPVQHYETITDDDKGNWRIQFWPDYDPAKHLRPTVVDEDRGTLTGHPDEGVRIKRHGPGIHDGRDFNEVRRETHRTATIDQITAAAPTATLSAQGAIRINVDGGTALNDASTLSAGGDLTVRGNGGAITARSVELERIERFEQTSSLYWHEKKGNSDRATLSFKFAPFERRTLVGGLPSIMSSNQTVTLQGQSVNLQSFDASGKPVVASDNIRVDASRLTHDKVHSRSATSDIQLPTSGLFKIRNAPNHPYLIESDPRFTTYGTFVSSDYLLNQLGIDPAVTEMRVGDGFLEGQLLLEQIRTRTGRVFLDEHRSADAQYRALMTSGARFAREHQLRVGIALSAEQMKALTSDIVWLVKQNVTLPDGGTQAVLMPKLYLAQTGRVRVEASGALVTGKQVAIQATERLDNTGRIVADAQTLVHAQDVINRGGDWGIASGYAAERHPAPSHRRS